MNNRLAHDSASVVMVVRRQHATTNNDQKDIISSFSFGQMNSTAANIPLENRYGLNLSSRPLDVTKFGESVFRNESSVYWLW